MNIPYRTRQLLLRIGIILLVAAVVFSLAFLCWFLWLQRYVVYTRDRGAVVDMQLSPQIAEGETPPPPESPEDVLIYYNEGENAINTSQELTQITGYYANAAALEQDIGAVMEQVKLLPPGTPVLLDVKSPKGSFFYSSRVSSNRNSAIDPEAMDELIDYLSSRNTYLIARLPALRDYYFGLNYTSNGLFVTSGSHLWADDDYCYWLNPTSDGTLTYLMQIVTELKNLGFDEVVFEEFRFPDTQNLKFSGDRAQAIADAAKTLVTSCATDTFAVSFVGAPDFALPEGRSRLYLEGAVAAQADAVAQQTGLSDPTVRLVFLTEIHDTRFDTYSVLRPLDAAH